MVWSIWIVQTWPYVGATLETLNKWSQGNWDSFTGFCQMDQAGLKCCVLALGACWTTYHCQLGQVELYPVWWDFDTDTFPPLSLLTHSHHGGILSWWEYAGKPWRTHWQWWRLPGTAPNASVPTTASWGEEAKGTTRAWWWSRMVAQLIMWREHTKIIWKALVCKSKFHHNNHQKSIFICWHSVPQIFHW